MQIILNLSPALQKIMVLLVMIMEMMMVMMVMMMMMVLLMMMMEDGRETRSSYGRSTTISMGLASVFCLNSI